MDFIRNISNNAWYCSRLFYCENLNFYSSRAFFLPSHPNVVPAPVFSVAFSCSFPFRKSWWSIPFRRSFSFQPANKKTMHRHPKSAEALLSLQNDVLCIGFEIQRRDCLFIRSLADSTKKHIVRMTVFSLSTLQALGDFTPHF